MRLRHTLPPLVFSGLQLVRELHAKTAEGGEEGALAMRARRSLAYASFQALTLR